MIESVIPIFAMLISIGMPLSIFIVWLVLNHRKRRRLMELHHAERMAAIERGMEVPPLPIELLDSDTPRRRSSLLPGLVWFCIGLALLIGILLMNHDEVPLLGALIPLGVGVGYLIYYFMEGRVVEARWREHDLARQRDARPAEHS